MNLNKFFKASTEKEKTISAIAFFLSILVGSSVYTLVKDIWNCSFLIEGVINFFVLTIVTSVCFVLFSIVTKKILDRKK